MSVPLLNGSLEISKAEISELWDDGYPTEDALMLADNTEGDGNGYTRSKHSVDGRWLIKYDPVGREPVPQKPDITAEELCTLHDAELNHIRALGMNVITFARIPFNEQRKVLEIMPWIPDIDDVTEKEFIGKIRPILREYLLGWQLDEIYKPTKRPYFAADLGQGQYSTGPSTNYIPFLHDIDPILKNEKGWITAALGI